MKTEIKINWLETGCRSNDTVLVCQFAGQSQLQDCYIELDCDEGVVGAYYNSEIGNSIPGDVYHDRTLRFDIPCITAEAANDLMIEIEPILQRVQNGYTSSYDRQSNLSGEYTVDANRAIAEIEEKCRFAEGLIDHIEPGDWFECDSELAETITATTTDEEVAEYAEAQAVNAWNDQQYLDEAEAEAWLTDRRDALIDD